MQSTDKRRTSRVLWCGHMSPVGSDNDACVSCVSCQYRECGDKILVLTWWCFAVLLRDAVVSVCAQRRTAVGMGQTVPRVYSQGAPASAGASQVDDAPRRRAVHTRRVGARTWRVQETHTRYGIAEFLRLGNTEACSIYTFQFAAYVRM